MKERRSNRLKGYDYSREACYFVTICVHDRIECLGEIKDGTVVLNQYGEIVKKQWVWLSEQYPYVNLNDFIVMPDHFHGILSIVNVGNGRDRSLQYKIKSLSSLMGAFKTTSSKLIRKTGLSKFCWQKSFYDHIVRNKQDLTRIRRYIMKNSYLDITQTAWYKKQRSRMTPGKTVKVYRQRDGLSQAELGRRLGGLSIQKISDIENDRRGVSKELAKKLADVFSTSADKFL